ncbi:hypothetical protein [Pseudofrankia inefficax]|uniref:hypothetical protein n=1 Tax=Pseudofrankia inefficax (strain DSM 45817 / CECT 9037 / DDB 130130 / EuI1c) TaxID=298654 RepID=UPI0003160135|nr:hypothetical protein [Pseudofrankia inefficax]
MAEAGNGAGAPAGLVVNERRRALLTAAAVLDRGTAEIATAFDGLAAALDAGAWAGPAAELWAGELARTGTTIRRALGDTALSCAHAAASQPEWVAPGDPRAVRSPARPGSLRDGR